MIEDGEATMGDAAEIIDADGQRSSQAIEACSDEASGDGLEDDPRPLAPPVGCTTPRIDAFPSPAPVFQARAASLCVGRECVFGHTLP